MGNIETTKRLIKEGHTTVHENLTDAMISIKKTNPNLSHSDVMKILKDEFDKFIKHHSDRIDLPKPPSEKPRIFRDKMPLIPTPYGGKRKKD